MVTSYRLSGDYDLANCADLATDLIEFAHRHDGPVVIVDGSDLAFIDSSGVGALIDVQQELRGRTLRVVNLPPLARRVVDILGATRLLGVTIATPTGGCGPRTQPPAPDAPRRSATARLRWSPRIGSLCAP